MGVRLLSAILRIANAPLPLPRSAMEFGRKARRLLPIIEQISMIVMTTCMFAMAAMCVYVTSQFLKLGDAPPLFLPAAAAAFPCVGFFTLWLFARQRRRMRIPRPNVCAVCDYDLTGNTSGTCPECGTRVVNASQK
jgi:hypothetical protein